MVEIIVDPPNPFQRAHSFETVHFGSSDVFMKDASRWITRQQMWVPPHPLGRHPFNILTEEIYG